ncbi:MAG: transcriptional regulator [Thermodesulfobacteriota bacterium]|nr:transcriptional regulator [Thermodesulfobacteriota bacterium]
MDSNLQRLARVWPDIQDMISVPHTGDDYERLVSLLDSVTDEVGEDENHPLASLMETIGSLVEAYEAQHVPEPLGDPIAVLKHLMADHRVKQSELKEIGSQGVVSEILSKKRQLNVRQIKRLGHRFNVSPAVFL